MKPMDRNNGEIGRYHEQFDITYILILVKRFWQESERVCKLQQYF